MGDTQVIDLTYDSSSEPESDFELAYKTQIAEYEKISAKSEMNEVSLPAPIVLYSPDTVSSPSIDSLLGAKLQAIEQRKFEQLKEQERADAELAVALKQLQEIEEKETKPKPRPTCGNSVMKASEIAKLYAPDDVTIPNIHEIFVHFDKTYFEGSLSYVVVKWSYHMKLFVLSFFETSLLTRWPTTDVLGYVNINQEETCMR